MKALTSVSVIHHGPAIDNARLVAVLLHGRGANAADIIGLAPEFDLPDVAFVAPDAPRGSWYPQSFLAPIDANEPYLSRSLDTVDLIVNELIDKGIDHRRIILAGFSQGACLSLEYAARNPRRYAAILGFSGGVIGPDIEPERYAGNFDRTPVYLGCSDIDPHIPAERVRETAVLFGRLNASVTVELFPGRPHSVYPEEIDATRAILASS